MQAVAVCRRLFLKWTGYLGRLSLVLAEVKLVSCWLVLYPDLIGDFLSEDLIRQMKPVLKCLLLLSLQN